MWIRNQDRTILMDCDSFAAEDHSGKYEVITLNCRTSISTSLGMYSTKEKILKVLDEIQRAVGSAKIYSTNRASNGHSMSNEYVMVYQMPQDEDVEV